MKIIHTLIWILVIALLAGGIFLLIKRSSEPGKLDTFTACLSEKGAVFYGAFWCPHCQNQKAMFGKSQKLLQYIECSTPDGKNQLQVCKDKNITEYPTWDFADGDRLTGEVSLSDLSKKTGCVLPE
jgi:hypothetical protein